MHPGRMSPGRVSYRRIPLRGRRIIGRDEGEDRADVVSSDGVLQPVETGSADGYQVGGRRRVPTGSPRAGPLTVAAAGRHHRLGPPVPRAVVGTCPPTVPVEFGGWDPHGHSVG